MCLRLTLLMCIFKVLELYDCNLKFFLKVIFLLLPMYCYYTMCNENLVSAIDYMQFLTQQKKKQEEDLDSLRKEVMALKIMKACVENIFHLPNQFSHSIWRKK